jgi:hypothetical protein
MRPLQTPPFAQSWRQAQILSFEILNVFLQLIRLRRIAFLEIESAKVLWRKHFSKVSIFQTIKDLKNSREMLTVV